MAEKYRSTTSSLSPMGTSTSSPLLDHHPRTGICFPSHGPRRVHSCGTATPLLEIVSPDDLLRPFARPSSTQTSSNNLSSAGYEMARSNTLVSLSMVYNEYGELVKEDTLGRPPRSHELSKTQLLRVIKKAYHHAYRNRAGKIIVPQMDGKSPVHLAEGLWKDRLSTWNFKPDSVQVDSEPTTDQSPMVPVYHGPPRVLEIGCSDGSWCFNFKKELPNWIVEGIDDTAHWSCVDKDIIHRDFMCTPDIREQSDYFSKVHFSQATPEFTVRNLNALITHNDPIPYNLYEFIRAREIFDRVENFKTFLEDIRLILKPDGVVEFLEIDPRPRNIYDGKRADPAKHLSLAPTDWTDKILDRFKDPFDEELATDVPGWTARVDERLEANLRPQDGVIAEKLKSCLEGAGFWDVKELVLPIPVGGSTVSGRLLKEFILYQVEIEDCIPKLVAVLPDIETKALESGLYCLNLHIVTGRKPNDPRPGDLLMDGTRQEMTAAKYSAMMRFKAMKSSQWQRFNLEGKLPEIMRTLTLLPGEHVISRGSREDGLRPLPSPGKELDFILRTPLGSPPFVADMELDADNIRPAKRFPPPARGQMSPGEML